MDNWSLDTDTQLQEAAARLALRAGQLQRYMAGRSPWLKNI